MKTCVDLDAQELVLTALVKDNSWFAIGFGPTMKDTDMIGWHVRNGVGETVDYYSTGYSAPKVDDQSNVRDDPQNPPVFDSQTKVMKFVTRRALDTGDESQDFKVELDVDMPMIYAYNEGTGDWRKHDKYGIWSMQFSSTGVSLDSELDEDDLRELLRDSKIEAHGWAMWSSWYVVGLLMLITKRYAKKTWKLNHYLHALLGYVILVVTLFYGFS